jgi:hypothetical protein
MDANQQPQQGAGDQPRPEAKRPSLAASILWLVALFVGMLVYAVASPPPAMRGAELLGYCMGGAGVIWAIFHFAFARRRGWGYSTLSYFVIFAPLFLGALASLGQQKIQSARMASGLQQDLNALVKSMNDPKGMPAPAGKIESAPAAQGEVGEVEKFIRARMNQMVTERNEYLRELDAIGWKTILSPDRVAKDTTLAQSREMVSKARGIASSYRAKALANMDGMRAEIAKLAVSERMKQDMQVGYDRNLEKSRGRLVEILDLEVAAVGEFDKIFDLFEKNKGAWTVRDGKFVFGTQALLNDFNSRLATINSMVQRQEALQKQGVDSAAASLENLKH